MKRRTHPCQLFVAGKKAFIAGVADDQACKVNLRLASLVRSPLTGHWTLQGFGWAIAKALAEAGAEISLGVWVSVSFPVTAGWNACLEHDLWDTGYMLTRILLSGACSLHL